MSIIFSLIKKVTYALCESLFCWRRPSHPILYMTLLVKNEEELLEQNLIFHKQMGVDGFIVTDNNSTDHTPDILRKYKELGWIKEIIQEPATDYRQKNGWIVWFGVLKLFFMPTGLSMPMLTSFGMLLRVI